MGSKGIKFSFTDDELSLFSDQSFFTKKRLVTGKIIDLFGSLESDYALLCQKHQDRLPESIIQKRGKISRGENYRGLPYVILDYPATFSKDGVFAFRTLMWWGNPISFTFHLSGRYFDQYIGALFKNLMTFDSQTLVCINSAQWEHHFEQTNYITIAEFLNSSDNNIDYFRSKGFLKLSKTIPIKENPKLFQTGLDFLQEILIKIK